MRPRLLYAFWLFVGVVVWNGFLDMYVSRGAREYGQKQAEADLGLTPHVSMFQVMDSAKRDGVEAASFWALGVVACGWTTIALARRSGRTAHQGPNPEPRTEPRT